MDGGHEVTLNSDRTQAGSELKEEVHTPTTLDEAIAQIQALQAEKKAMEEWVHSLMDENREFASRYAELEEQNNSLANLYVSSYQLHSTLDLEVILRTIREIIGNLVGAEAFRVFLMDDRTAQMHVATQEGYPPGHASAPVVPGTGILGNVAGKGEPYFSPAGQTGQGDEEDQLIAAVPLKVSERIIGLISVERLLPHKPMLEAVDYELFSVLADHAAMALFSCKLYAESEATLRTLRSALKRAVEDKAAASGEKG